MGKWWCIASLVLCLAVAQAVAARDMPSHGRGPVAGNNAGVSDSKDVFTGSNGGNVFGGVTGPLGGGIVGFGPLGGFAAGGGPFGGFGGGGGLGGGGGGGGTLP